MKSNNNFILKLDKNNPNPIPTGVAVNSSNDNIILQNSNEKDQNSKLNQITVFHNNINQEYDNNFNKNNYYNNQIKELSKIQSSNKVSQKEENIDSSIHIYYDLSSKFLMKIYGIVLFQFIIIFALVLIFQIRVIKYYLHENIAFFWAFLGISIFVLIFPVILFICFPNVLKKVPYNYIILFTFTLFLAIFCAFIASFYHFHAVLGAITCIIAICIGSFCIGLFNKGDNSKVWYFILSSAVCLVIHYCILAIIFRNYYIIFLLDTAFAILYSIYIAFDTINIKKNFSLDDYIAAAIILDIDIIRLFLILLRLFGSKND